MGSFNVSCSVSNISIGYGTKVAFFFLKQKNELVQTTNISRETSYYKPFAFPIFGKYDEYGSIENIVRDNNTKVIEKYFDMTIDEIIEVVCSRQRSGNTELDNLSGMFVHYDIYKMMSKKFVDEFGNFDELLMTRSYLNDYALIQFGFKFIKTDKSIKRYNRIYKFDNVERYIIHSDGTWSYIFDTVENKEIRSVYSLKKLAKTWLELTNINVDISKFKKEFRYNNDFDRMIEAIKEYKYSLTSKAIKEKKKKEKERVANLTPEELEKEEKEKAELKKLFEKLRVNTKNLESSFEIKEEKNKKIDYFLDYKVEKFVSFKQLRKYDELYNSYLNIISKRCLRKEIREAIYFENNLFSMNKFYFPALNGCQFGNYYISKELYKKSLQIVNKKLKRKE